MHESLHGLIDIQQGIVLEFLDEQASVSGLLPTDDKTWAIYGSIPGDGEEIVAEFDNRADAESALEQIAGSGAG
jgi:hypothetical protein